MIRKAISWKLWVPAVAVATIVGFLTRTTGEISVVFALGAGLGAFGFLLQDVSYARACPHCRSALRGRAVVCARCGREVDHGS